MVPRLHVPALKEPTLTRVHKFAEPFLWDATAGDAVVLDHSVTG